MKHKIYAQFLLLICSVVSCSEVPVNVSGRQSISNKIVNEQSIPIVSTSAGTTLLYDDSAFTINPEQRAAFLQAEQMFLQQDEVEFFAQMQQLKGYPLYPYLQSQWLRKNLGRNAEIEAFLVAYKDTYYADLVRQDWLLWLAQYQQWAQFVQYYQAKRDDSKIPLHCHFAHAQYLMGQQDLALNLAQTLWIKGVSQPACDEIFAIFMQSPQFSEKLIWQRFSAIFHSKKPNLQLAIPLKQYLSPDSQKIADLWLKIANSNLSTTIRIWEAQKITTNPELVNYVEQKIGLALIAVGDDDNAYAHLIQVTDLDEKTHHVLLRIALKNQDWSRVSQIVTILTPDEKTQNKWRYWQARALEETGKINEANTIFSELTQKTDYYALLAAHRIKQPYRAIDNPVPVTTQDMKALQQQNEIKIVAEWFALGRKDEALLQWWGLVKKSTPQQIMTVAKLAQHWQMPKLAAFTIAKADYWQDLELRFPMVFSQEINDSASKYALDPAIIFGLIRQESVFDELAGSSVGARGLMQIMPATGRQIAKQLQEPWNSDMSLYEPSTNIRYGTFYFKQLLDKFDGQVALAAAGYNAGPGRVKNWRPARAMPMDVWIETIPFTETRQYVGMVLANTLFYQQRMNRDVLKISDFFSEVQPS